MDAWTVHQLECLHYEDQWEERYSSLLDTLSLLLLYFRGY